jgi:hypothetical protein
MTVNMSRILWKLIDTHGAPASKASSITSASRFSQPIRLLARAWIGEGPTHTRTLPPADFTTIAAS